MKKKIIVVGGGAAGLMAAGRAADRGHPDYGQGTLQCDE